jgi:hypothetical protein
MNKIELSLNYKEIIARIEAEMEGFKVSKWAKFLGVNKNVISNFHGKSSRRNPSMEYIITISLKTGKPIEWYLWGKKAEQESITKEKLSDQFERRDYDRNEELSSIINSVREIYFSNDEMKKSFLRACMNGLILKFSTTKIDNDLKEIKKYLKNITRSLKTTNEAG